MPLLSAADPTVDAAGGDGGFSPAVSWYGPNATWINNLTEVVGGHGLHGFVFNDSETPAGAQYGTYNYCNMPHVRRQEYPVAGDEYELVYVEVIHRHHKRTPYASNCFVNEPYPWDCTNAHLFYYGQPSQSSAPPEDAPDAAPDAAPAYWTIQHGSTNPFQPSGCYGNCQFPQITQGGLSDSWQHGRDLRGVYGELLGFLPGANEADAVEFRVTNNVITSQVAGMMVSAMGFSDGSGDPFPLTVQPSSTDSLEPSYECPKAEALYESYGVGSVSWDWHRHLAASDPLFDALDAVSGVLPGDEEFHKSWDHYFDSLSSRQCHGYALPCREDDGSGDEDEETQGDEKRKSRMKRRRTTCITQQEADTVYRLGQYEYSYIYRDSPHSLLAATGSFGVWLAELSQHVRDAVAGAGPVRYRHNVAHDGSLSRLLSLLQIDAMVWPGMGAEVVFELFRKQGEYFVRALWGGQPLRSSHPKLGVVDMVDVDVLLDYIDDLVGVNARRVLEYCET
ncbi:acid phosphatase [Lineolata rhizophorae]|uniref:Acid phosphatase n=1 Tax=Lineolata rhizophorae TaxID=578093 RepID=A0A6A6P999_9PEZI|nr:acid phosphatase [Lineolata rhizophorae]